MNELEAHSDHSKTRRGRQVARLLEGSWRGAPLTSSPDALTEIANLLTTCGAGGLAWCKVRNSEMRDSQIAELFRAQYRYQSLRAALHQRNLKRVIPLLRAEGVEPILVKGWAIARLYPEAGMRPYVDLDLCVAPKDYGVATDVLKRGECDDVQVDLHDGFGKFYDRRTDDIIARSRLVKLDDLDVRVLSPEDDLRFLCLHLLRHGAVQPLWLCDVALLLESIGAEFDWDRCFAGSGKEADWIACTLKLAQELLGASVEGTPVAHKSRPLPDWLTSAVLEEWGSPLKTLPQLKVYLRNPRRWIADLGKEWARHWPNPIEATMTLRGPFNRLPRFPFQIGHLLLRTVAVFSQLVMGLGNAVGHRS